jgi:checkpoint serine/threonine-protein kinase
MATSGDLISFDLIETHKENIQSLPGGRSAKKLASLLSPSPVDRFAVVSPNATQNIDDEARREFETEILNIGESDDPLDIYDRYVKWTLDAYPSAQATPQSQLLPLLERATKAFLSSTHYKNDPRYLKLWLQYIRFFSDTPRETFAFLAKHKIGDGLALFYEEFAAWLEGAGRWKQAEEVYQMGIDKEARPMERLMRKYGEFQRRSDNRQQSPDEPSSPALPTVRPALAAKIDPFAVGASPPDQQSQAAGIGGSAKPKSNKQKLAVVSDADAPEPSLKQSIDGAHGWENIGSLQHRKKENTIEARPWVGETLKGGKKNVGVQKMSIFRDEVS